MTSTLSGFLLPVEAARLLARERSLWGPALVPLLLSLLAFSAAVALVAGFAGEIWGAVTQWLPELEAGAWYTWIWIGPGKLLTRVLGGLLFAVAAGVALVMAYLVASLLASPFHDELAQRVERLATGDVRDASTSDWIGLLREGGRAVREELRRLLFFAAVVGPLALFGFAIPGLHLLTAPAILAFTIFFLPLDYASYTLDRRRLSFAEKRQWLLANAGANIGFGGAAFFTCLVPFLNLAAMPLLVVAGTLLALRSGAADARGRGASAGTTTSP